MYPSDIFSRMYSGEENIKLYPKREEAPSEVEDVLQTNLFNVMLNRRSQRKFEDRQVWRTSSTSEGASSLLGYSFMFSSPEYILEKMSLGYINTFRKAPAIKILYPDKTEIVS